MFDHFSTLSNKGLKHQTTFEHFDESYKIFKKLDNTLLFWLIKCDFFSEYNRAGVFNQSEIRNEQATNFRNVMYCKFQKI